MQQMLQPFMNEMRESLTSLREELTSLNETIREHKSQTISELADLQTSIQSSIDNPPTGRISRAVLLKVLPYLNDIKGRLKRDTRTLISDKYPVLLSL